MGLFGKKELCPICGRPVKGLVRFKIAENLYLCQECGQKVAMDDSMLPFQSVDDIKKHLAYREINLQSFRDFTVSREIRVGSLFFRVDDGKQLWYCAAKKDANPPLFKFDEVLNYELTEDGETIIKGGLGRAVVGGALFGGVGAVVGGITGKKKGKQVVKSMRLRISLRNPYTTSMVLDFIPNGIECKVGSFTYNAYKQDTNAVMAILDNMASGIST